MFFVFEINPRLNIHPSNIDVHFAYFYQKV